MHDLDVDLARKTIAVEVTRHTLASSVAQEAEIAKRTWREPALTMWWSVSVGRVRDVNRLHREIGRLLWELETAGIERISIHRRTEAPPAGLALFALGVRWLR